MNGRLMCVFSLAIIGLFINTGQSQMIADITEDVETEFGTYQPYPVEIVPDAEPYAVEPDFSNVVNFSDFSFTAVEESLLAENYFVFSPVRDEGGTGYKEIYDIYNECRENGVPIFVTTDAMLHTFHLCFDKILKTIEEQRLFGDLHGMLLALFNETMEQYETAKDSTVRGALIRNLNYLIVATTLLDSTFDSGINGGPFLEELAFIQEHSGFEISPIFGYAEDYSQYIPRGHYTDSDSLRRYFLSMMWLGRMTFAADPIQPEMSREATLSAILLLQAFEKTEVLSFWENIYLPTVFFVGKSDDINYYQYEEIALQVYGGTFTELPPDDFVEEVSFNEFLDLAMALPGPKISYPWQPKGFRLMGQRFIPDSYILDQVVMLFTSRLLPKGLDVMSVLGSDRAYQILDEVYHEMWDLAYVQQLANLKAEFEAYPDAVWAQNVYWNWLYSLMPLLFNKGEGYPPFMQNQAWTDKELNAALGSWAELRHDTILYAKQSGSETGIPPASYLEQGYVEPNPYLYARLAALDQLMITGLEGQGLLFSSFGSSLTTLRDLLLSLKAISEKELTNQPLTGEEYDIICNIGRTIEAIVEFQPPEWIAGPMPDSEDEMPVIADVHTDANSEFVLEEGVGYPFNIYVICNIEGELKVTRGAAFSYYEFPWPMQDRLTDEAWITMLQSNEPPLLPIWTESFLDQGHPLLNDDPWPYMWWKQSYINAEVTVEEGSYIVGETVTVHVSSIATIAPEPSIQVIAPDGSSFSVTNLWEEGDDYAGSFSTDAMPAGRIHLECEICFDWDPPECIIYRTSFELNPDEESLAHYYPLHIGNNWIFSISSICTIHTESIVDTQRISGDLYFEFDLMRHFPGVLLRMSEDNKLMMLTGGAEQVWLDFSADVGDTWNVETQIEDRWLVHLESKEDTVSVPAGTFTNCYRFLFEWGCCDNDWLEWYAPGVGPVKRTHLGFAVMEYPLARAVIDGVLIGVLKGDLDGNGDINVSDVVMVVNIILNIFEPTPDQFWAADMNEDDKIDILDVVGLIQYILGLPDKTYVVFENVENYGNFCVEENGTSVITSDLGWMDLWERYWNVYDGQGNKTPPPEVNFDKEMVIGVFWGGYCAYSGCTNESPSIESVWIENDTLWIKVGELKNLGPCDMCVCPLHLIQTQKLDMPVRFVGDVP